LRRSDLLKARRSNVAAIAEQASATGSLTVANDGSEFDAASLTFADEGVATVTISDGGDISVGDDLTIGDGAGSSGEANIADAQSSGNFGGDLTIGGSGDGVLTDNGDFSVDGDIKIDEEDGGVGTFTLNGATLDASDSKVTVGEAGNGLMIVQQASSVTVDSIFAEGLPAESYLETGNRGAFANGG
jgi:T5SS/PEP-CTERM-associated repeat protein